MIDRFFRFLELRYAGEIRELTGKIIASPIDECNRPRAVCRTLVVTRPKVRTWGFWCAPDRFVPWDQFDGGCGEEQS